MLHAAWKLAITLALQTAPAGSGATHVAPDGRPFTRLVQNLGHDARALPTATSGLVAGAGLLSALIAHPSDQPLAGWADDHGRPGYTRIGAVLGDGWIQAGAAVGVYAAGELSHDERTTALGADLVRGQVLNGVLTQGLKVLVGRPRPGGGHHSSFPSGHTSAAFANAAILQQHLGWKVGVAAYGTAGFIGWTRVRDHDHYLSDVLAGTAIGIVAGQTVSRPHGRGSWIVTPSASPTQVAVYISRRP